MYKDKITLLFSILIIFTVIIYIFFNGHYSNCITFIDHLYFSSTTFTFVGYGDIGPKTQEAKFLTNVYMLIVFYIVFIT
jgi:hypothetical protein